MSQQNGGFPGDRQGNGQQDAATPHVFPFGTPQSPEQQAWSEQQAEFGSGPQHPAEPRSPFAGTSAQQWDPATAAQPQQPAPYDQPQGSGAQQAYGQGQYPQEQYGSQPQYGQQPYGEQPQYSQEQYDQQQYGSQQQYGQQPYGSQPQQPYGSQPQYGQEPHGSQNAGQQYTEQQNYGSAPGQQFSGILDPQTGEIHPVPNLTSLDDSDALLVVVSGPDAGAQILLDTDVVSVGRSPKADIFLDDVTVSRQHAEFVRTPSGFMLRDTGSLNGTYVGRQLIDSIELQNGADVQIGKFRMIFQQRPRTA